jgi:hypothetical protein
VSTSSTVLPVTDSVFLVLLNAHFSNIALSYSSLCVCVYSS